MRILTALVLLLAAAAAAAFYVVPPLAAPRLAAALTKATGHPASIAGGVRVVFDVPPMLEADDVSLANPPGFSRAALLIVPKVLAQMGWADLLGGEVRIASVQLLRPDLVLERDAHGRANWTPMPGATSQGAAPSPPRGTRRVSLGTISVADGHVLLRDAGRLGRVEAAVDGAADLADPSVIPVHAVLRSTQGTVLIEGRVDPADPWRGTDLRLEARLALSPPLNVSAHLTKGAAFSADLQSAGLTGKVAGTLDPATLRPAGPVAVSLTAPDLPAVAPLSGRQLPPGPATLQAHATVAGSTVTLGDLVVRSKLGELSGDIALDIAGRPGLRGHLASPALDVDVIRAAVAPAPPPPAPTADQAPAPAAGPAEAPAPPAMPFGLLRAADADLTLSVGQMHGARVTARDVVAHIVLRDGRLTMEPFTGTLPGGAVAATLRADGVATPPNIAATLQAPSLAVGPTLAAVGIGGADLGGVVAVDADLRAAGTTTTALLASLTGQASAVLVNGDIDNRLFATLLSAAQIPPLGANGLGRTHVRCLVIRSTLTNGTAHIGRVVVDTPHVQVQGGGDIDLVRETFDLRLRPLLRAGPGVIVPVTLGGSFRAPRVLVDRNTNVDGVLAGIAAPGQDGCHAAGVAVPAESSPSTSSGEAGKPKAPKPIDVLRQLLR